MHGQPKASHFIGGKAEEATPLVGSGEVRVSRFEAGFYLEPTICTDANNNTLQIHRTIDRIKAKTCWINTCNMMPVRMPFRNIKKSGVDRDASKTALDHHSQLKSTFVERDNLVTPY